MLNPNAPEYIPASQSSTTSGVVVRSEIQSAAACLTISQSLAFEQQLYHFNHHHPPTHVQGFGCLPPPPQQQLTPDFSIFPLYQLPPQPQPPPAGGWHVAPVSKDDDVYQTRKKAEFFPAGSIHGRKKIVPPRHLRRYSGARGCGGFGSNRKRLESLDRSRCMAVVNSRVEMKSKPEENNRLLKKHSVLPLKHDEEITTVMIKNIPYELTRLNLMEILDSHCLSENQKEDRSEEEGKIPNPTAYDFLYLPIDFKNKKNKGYAFVNFTTTRFVWKFFNAFNETKWESNNSPMIKRIVCARIQGTKALVDHFSKSYFECESEEFLPVCFSPPRDGSGTTVRLITVGRLGLRTQFNPRSRDHHHHHHQY